MALSIREKALAGLLTEIEAISAIPGLAVLRNEDADIEKFPALNQLDADSSQRVVDRAGGNTLYAIDLEIEGYVTATTPAARGPAVSELYAETIKAAIGAQANVPEIFEVIEGDFDSTLVTEDDVAPHAFFLLSLEIHFGTPTGDPFTFA